MKIHPSEIAGPWEKGFALDKHVISSEFIGYNESGHAQFDTTRSEMGELLYKLKYQADYSVVEKIAVCAAEFLNKWDPKVDLIIPATPSRQRTKQPVFVIGAEISSRTGVDFAADFVKRSETLPELKNVDHATRHELLKNAHEVEAEKIKGRKILLFDDLFQTGSTMSAICEALLAAEARSVFALTLTKARS